MGTMENAIHESTAKKILHKLNPGHHNHKDKGKGPDDTAEVHQSPEVTDDVKPLVERTKHVHSRAEHPAVESCVPLLTLSSREYCMLVSCANLGPPSSLLSHVICLLVLQTRSDVMTAPPTVVMV